MRPRTSHPIHHDWTLENLEERVARIVGSLGGDRYITTREYCILRGWKSTQTARRERMCGDGPPFTRTGLPPYGRCVYLLSDVIRHMELLKVRSTAEEYACRQSKDNSHVSLPSGVNDQHGAKIRASKPEDTSD